MTTIVVDAAETDDYVPLDLLKRHARITHNEEDELLRTYLTAATKQLEKHTCRTLLTRTYRLTMRSWPLDFCEFRHAPFIDLVGVTYYDADNAQQTLPVDYGHTVLLRGTNPVYGHFGGATEWPTAATRSDAIAIDYRAGSTRTAEITVGILQLASHFYRNREATAEMKVSEVPKSYQYIVNLLRVGNYAGR